MKAENKSYQQGFWKNHSAAWEASGLTQQAYCEQEGISYQSFVYQHNRLSAAQSKKPPVSFIKASPELTTAYNQSVGLQLLLPNGIRIGIGAEVNVQLLQAVLNVAGTTKC
jgi:hypothetical protein